jgi:hypothetical protein
MTKRDYVANSSSPVFLPKWKPPSSSYPTGIMEFRICCQGAVTKHLNPRGADELVDVGLGEGVEFSGWTSFEMMWGSLIFQVSSFNPERAYRILLSDVHTLLSFFANFFLWVYTPIMRPLDFTICAGQTVSLRPRAR